MDALPTVLIVDDDDELRAYVARRLRPFFSISQAGSCTEALTCLRSPLPDLILLDIVLPDKNGLTFLDELRLDSGFSHIPVVLMTGGSFVHNARESLSPLTAFLPKPFASKDLLATIRRLLD